MKKKKDRSMLYAALAGFLLFVLTGAAIRYIADFGGEWHESEDFGRYFSFPEGTTYEHTDSHGGFHGDGVGLLVAQIPPEHAEEFIQILWEKGFTDAPVPEHLRAQIQNDPETEIVAEAFGMWWFEDESPGAWRGYYANYTFHIYDIDTYTYYYIEYDT